MDDLSTDLAVDEEYKNFLAHFYTVAFAGLVESWLREPPGKEESPEKLMRYSRITMHHNTAAHWNAT